MVRVPLEQSHCVPRIRGQTLLVLAPWQVEGSQAAGTCLCPDSPPGVQGALKAKPHSLVTTLLEVRGDAGSTQEVFWSTRASFGCTLMGRSHSHALRSPSPCPAPLG